MTPQDLIRRLAEGRIEPLYLVSGEESWLVEEVLAAFRRHVMPPEFELLNAHVVSGADLAPTELVAMAETLPAFSPRRFILVRDADRLAASEALTAYCRAPSPTTCLVFVAAKPDRRKALIQALLEHATPVPCDPLRPAQLTEWMTRYAAGRGVTLTHEAAAYFRERAGGSLRAIAHEIDQFALGYDATGEDGPGRATGGSHSVFDWAHAVAMGETSRAVEGLNRLLRDEAPLLLLAILAGQWRKMLRYAALDAEGLPATQMAKALGIPPFAIPRLTQAARRRTLATLSVGLTRCLETESGLKGGALAGPLALEELVVALCRGEEHRARQGPRAIF